MLELICTDLEKEMCYSQVIIGQIFTNDINKEPFIKINETKAFSLWYNNIIEFHHWQKVILYSYQFVDDMEG